MFRQLFIMTIVTVLTVGALVIVTAGPTPSTNFNFQTFQNNLQQISANDEAALLLQGHILLAGRGSTSGSSTVRDHRSCGSDCGPYSTYGHGGIKNTTVSPGNGEGGVTVTPSGTQRGPSCLGDWC